MRFAPRTTLLSLALFVTTAAPAFAQSCTVEDFEGFQAWGGLVTPLGISSLDENTVVMGQGPGLVADGCTYDANLVIGVGNELEWCGSGGNLLTPSLGLSSSNGLGLVYDSPVDFVSIDIYDSLPGPPIAVDIHVYDSQLNQIHFEPAFPIAQGVPSTFSFAAADIARVIVGWDRSIVDAHVFGTGPTCPVLVGIGECGGFLTNTGVGARLMTPGGPVGFAWAPNSGALTRTVPGCGPVATGLGGPLVIAGVVTADAYGAANLLPPGGIPAGACGGYLQAVDLTTCAVTNVLGM